MERLQPLTGRGTAHELHVGATFYVLFSYEKPVAFKQFSRDLCELIVFRLDEVPSVTTERHIEAFAEDALVLELPEGAFRILLRVNAREALDSTPTKKATPGEAAPPPPRGGNEILWEGPTIEIPMQGEEEE